MVVVSQNIKKINYSNKNTVARHCFMKIYDENSGIFMQLPTLKTVPFNFKLFR